MSLIPPPALPPMILDPCRMRCQAPPPSTEQFQSDELLYFQLFRVISDHPLSILHGILWASHGSCDGFLKPRSGPK